MQDEAVVVGVDGGAPSLLAVRWAAAEAARRVVPLRVLSAYHWRVPLTAFAPTSELAETAQRFADMLVADIAREASAAAAGVMVQAAAMPGHPAEVLLKAGCGAAQPVVIGSRGHGGFAGLLLGSVGLRLLHRADCPVLIAHAPPGTTRTIPACDAYGLEERL